MVGKIAATVARIFRLWGVQAYLDFLWMTRDAKFFLLCYVSEIIVNVAAVTTMLLLAQRFDGIGQWSKVQFVFLLGYGSLARGMVNTFFGFNIFHISRRIGRGQLDHTLIIPLPVWMTFLTEGFTPFQSSCTLLPGVALLGWSLARLHMPFSAGWWDMFAVNLFSSAAVMIALAFIWGSVAFWAPRAGEEINTSLDGAIEGLKVFPLDGVGPLLLGGLTLICPIGFLAWYPCRALLGLSHQQGDLWWTTLAAVACLALAAGLFWKGLRYYARTGSPRYAARGHRS